MEVALLQPHDCLKRHHHHHRRPLISPVNKSRHNTTSDNPIPNPNPNKSNRRRRNSPPPPPKAQKSRSKSPPVMGQVRILKRGEDLSLPTPPAPSPPPPPPPPMMSEPEDRSRRGQVLDGFYAGFAFVASPSPSEVPLPAFFARRNCGLVNGGEAHNQEIACVLRKALNIV